jgi:hypothetical protein
LHILLLQVVVAVESVAVAVAVQVAFFRAALLFQLGLLIQ